ncbi:MAG: calcium-binding protein, partial [Synechocystis sp.]
YSGFTGGDWSVDEGYDTITDTGTTGTDRILAQSTGNVDICLINFDVSNGIEIIDASGATGTVRLLGQWEANLLDFSRTQLIGSNIEICGEDGDDTLIGSNGNDRIFGGGGEDTLIGGLGTDQLTGGDSGDYFVFNASAEIGLGANRDRILDFQTTLDFIDLSAIDANTLMANDQGFTFIGSTAFVNAPSAAGQLRFAGGVLSGDTNGDSVSDFELALNGVTTLPVTALVL